MIVRNLGLENVKIILKKLSQESFIQDWKPGYLMGIFFFVEKMGKIIWCYMFSMLWYAWMLRDVNNGNNSN